MATTYQRHTLGELITRLRELPADAEVDGLGDEVDSYRGYYERNAIYPARDNIQNPHVLAEKYAAQIGKPTVGWKGGDFRVADDQLVYLAQEGDTGPAIIGLRQNPFTKVYEPVLLAEDWHF